MRSKAVQQSITTIITATFFPRIPTRRAYHYQTTLSQPKRTLIQFRSRCSKMFDMGTAGSGANTNDPGSGNTNSTTTNGQNGTTTEVSPVQGGGGTTTKGGATGTGGTGPTAITTGTSKQAGATGTTGSGTGSTGGTGSTSGSSGDSTSTDSSASGLNSDWMGLKVKHFAFLDSCFC